MEIFGSKKARRKFENAFKSDADWANVFLEDSRDLGTKDAATATADVLTQRAFTQYVKGLEEGFPKLPQKLHLMNARQACDFLSKLVLFEYWRAGGRKTRIVFKDGGLLGTLDTGQLPNYKSTITRYLLSPLLSSLLIINP